MAFSRGVAQWNIIFHMGFVWFIFHMGFVWLCSAESCFSFVGTPKMQKWRDFKCLTHYQQQSLQREPFSLLSHGIQ